jgi:membrane-bound ClpP family serine protease
MSIELTEIERRVIEWQRQHHTINITDGLLASIMATYIRELEAKAGNSECDEKLRESLVTESMRRSEAEAARDAFIERNAKLRADLVAAQEQNLLLSNELRKAKDRAEAAHLTDQQMMEFAIDRMRRYAEQISWPVTVYVAGTVGTSRGFVVPKTKAIKTILAATKGDA